MGAEEEVGILPETDTVDKVITTHAGSYKAIQMATFKSLDTIPSDWKMCEIKDLVFKTGLGEVPIFFLPEGYTEIPHTRFPETMNSRCQLCGHPILRLFYLQCDSKKIILQVGSECVNTYIGAHYTEKQIKIFKDNRVRQIFRAWRPLVMEDIEKHRGPKPTWSSYREGWLKEPYYSLLKKLRTLDDMKSTSRVINNFMNKCNNILYRKEKEEILGELHKKQ
jgi:hypothetical protein